MERFDKEDFRQLGNEVVAEQAGVRADLYLARQFPFFSREMWKMRIRSGEVRLNDGRVIRPSYRVQSRDCFHYYHPESREPQAPEHLDCIYTSPDLLVINKPAGLPMHEGGAYRKHTFAYRLKEQFGEEWAFVHRLDRETSGLVICARTSELRQVLAQQFRQNQIQKLYLAVVPGQVPLDKDLYCREPIGQAIGSSIRIKRWVNKVGQPAETTFRALSQSRQHSLMLCYPKTGRTNQIRIHLAYLGYPIVADKLYQPDESIFLDFWEHGVTKDLLEKLGHPRMLLHAMALKFFDPSQNKIVKISVLWPEDMKNFWVNHGGALADEQKLNQAIAQF